MGATDRVFTASRAGRGHPSICPGHPGEAPTARNRWWGCLARGSLSWAAMTTTSLEAVEPAPALVAAVVLPAAARPVSIADRVARGFPPLACVRGFRYFARRRVAFSNVSEAGLDAEVRGKRTL